MEIKTTYLSGRFLDWAVANSMGVDVEITENGTLKLPCGEVYSPSTNWSQGGKLIDEFMLEFDRQWTGIGAYNLNRQGTNLAPDGAGETHLIAACKAVVYSRYGLKFVIPREVFKRLA